MNRVQRVTTARATYLAEEKEDTNQPIKLFWTIRSAFGPSQGLIGAGDKMGEGAIGRWVGELSCGEGD